MARRSRRSKGISDGARGLLLALLGLGLIGAFGIGFWWVKATRPTLDAENCPAAGPTGIHVILFDRSDPISDQQGQRIRQAIERYRQDAAFGVRFDLYTFQGDTASTSVAPITSNIEVDFALDVAAPCLHGDFGRKRETQPHSL